MSFETDGTFVLIGLLVPAGLLVSFVTLPRWCIRSMSKHALWRLRDDVVDDALAGRLPSEHPAVRELVARIEWAIKESHSFDVVHLLAWVRACRNLPEDTGRHVLKTVSLEGLGPESTQWITDYRAQYDRVAIRALLLSSWIGIALVCRYAIADAFALLLHRATPDGLRRVVTQATDEVASETSLGRQARQFVTAKGPALEPIEPAVA